MTSLAECSQTENRECPRDKAKALRQQIDDRLDTLARAVDDVRASEMFQRYLEVQARFHRYSWHNTMLIASQFPEASNVAGFQTWRKLGRFVRKGEHGIAIFAPCPWKRTEVDEQGKEQEREGRGEVEIENLGHDAHRLFVRRAAKNERRRHEHREGDG